MDRPQTFDGIVLGMHDVLIKSPQKRLEIAFNKLSEIFNISLSEEEKKSYQEQFRGVPLDDIVLQITTMKGITNSGRELLKAVVEEHRDEYKKVLSQSTVLTENLKWLENAKTEYGMKLVLITSSCRGEVETVLKRCFPTRPNVPSRLSDHRSMFDVVIFAENSRRGSQPLRSKPYGDVYELGAESAYLNEEKTIGIATSNNDISAMNQVNIGQKVKIVPPGQLTSQNAGIIYVHSLSEIDLGKLLDLPKQ